MIIDILQIHTLKDSLSSTYYMFLYFQSPEFFFERRIDPPKCPLVNDFGDSNLQFQNQQDKGTVHMKCLLAKRQLFTLLMTAVVAKIIEKLTNSAKK